MQQKNIGNNYHLPSVPTCQDVLIANSSLSFGSVWLIQLDILSELRKHKLTHTKTKIYATIILWQSVPTCQDILVDNWSVSFGSVYKFTLADPAWHLKWTEKSASASHKPRQLTAIDGLINLKHIFSHQLWPFQKGNFA